MPGEEPWGAGRLPERRPAGRGGAAKYVVAAVWAPSVHNTQPWRFTAAGQEISVYADAGRQLVVADPDGREMMISCGAALFTGRLALRSLRFGAAVQVGVSVGRPLEDVLSARGSESAGVSDG